MIEIDKLNYVFNRDGLTIYGTPGHIIRIKMNAGEKLAFAQNAAASAVADMGTMARAEIPVDDLPEGEEVIHPTLMELRARMEPWADDVDA